MNINTRRLIYFFCFLPALLTAGGIRYPVIPKPAELHHKNGYFYIKPECKLIIDRGSKEQKDIASFFIEKLSFAGGPTLKTFENISEHAGRNIILTFNRADTTLGPEGYELMVGRKGILLRANKGNGLFMGLRTLFQLMPPEIEGASSGNNDINWKIPAVHIKDKARFPYRGMHLDVGRHLFPLEFIKKYIDLLSMYKMNTFHWHLTDDQGWRIEIKKYPRLMEVGAWRKGSQEGKTENTDPKPYGGYYTQDQIREVLDYAAKRYVTVIPEIEMPGHAVAALASFPHLSCTGGPLEVRTLWGVADDIFCAGNDSTFLFLEDVLTEVMALFPSGYIHIGGDEAPKARWEKCPKCQKRIHDEGLKDEHELQSYFIQRIEKFLNSHGRRIIGWDEILEGGLAPDATVMSWRGMDGGIQAARQGNDAIMTPGTHCYFDYYQADPLYEELAIGGYNTLKNVYSFEPVPPELNEKERVHILGAQGNLWTEYIDTSSNAEYMAYPRAIALAEVNWSPPESRNWPDFTDRLEAHFRHLDHKKVNYFRSMYDPEINTHHSDKGQLVLLSSPSNQLEIHYTLDGSEPVYKSPRYKKPFKLDRTTTIRARLFKGKDIKGRIISRTVFISKAYGKPARVIQPYSKRYPGKDSLNKPTGYTLVDGLRGNLAFRSGEWHGYLKNDMEVIVDLQQAMEISIIAAGFLKSTPSWIFFPEKVDFFISDDGINFLPAGTVVNPNPGTRGSELKDFRLKVENKTARFIKVHAISPGTCPVWHEAAGQPAWIFCDEIFIE